MILTEKQEKGIQIATQRFLAHEKYTIISGFAGTGKSTLVSVLVQNLPGIDPEKDVVYACYTGKATQVLRAKGNKNVSTLHKLVYESFPRPDGSFVRRKKLTIDYRIVVVDEVSMVPKDMWEQLMTYSCYVIALGDPFQLPPINRDTDNRMLEHPHIFLDKIMRQEEGNEIIQCSLDVREGRPLKYTQGNTKNVMILPKSQLNTGMLMWADQILCATNNTRTSINMEIRNLLGRGSKPEDGDKLICLRNYWDNVSTTGDFLINGSIGTLNNSYVSFGKIPYFFKADNDMIDYIVGDFVTEVEGEYKNLSMDREMIINGKEQLPRKLEYKLATYNQGQYAHLIPYQFTYGYAITCHKAQGSQFDKVLVLEEKFPFDRTEHARWLYTAITRACDKVVIVR